MSQQQNTSAPLDKQSKPMRLLVQIDLEELAVQHTGLPERGVLTVYVSESIDKCQPKDKKCFKVVWQAPASQAPQLVRSATATNETIVKNKITGAGSIATSLPDCFVLGNAHPRLEEAKAICAFSANGITYNETRAQDDCYAHLIAQCPNWQLLLRLHEKSADYLLLINRDDFAEARFDKAWLVWFKGNS